MTGNEFSQIISLILGFIGFIIAIALISAIFEIRRVLRAILEILARNATALPPGREFDRLRKKYAQPATS